MVDLAPIGWTLQGRRHTPADPCTFRNPTRCLPDDTEQWAIHAAAWLDTAERAADDDAAKLAIVAELRRWLDRIVSERCTVFGCHVQVAGLIEVARGGRAYATVWSSDEVEAPNTDPWRLDRVRDAIESAMSAAAKQLTPESPLAPFVWIAVVVLLAIALR